MKRIDELKRTKFDEWYDRHQGLTALIYLAIVGTIFAFLPHGAFEALWTSALGGFIVGLVRALKRR